MADFARAERLRELRNARHLNQEDAAHEIGVSTKSLRAWEKGGRIKWPNAKSAAAFYGVDPESLVSRETSPSISPISGTPDFLGGGREPAPNLAVEMAAIRVEIAALSTQLAMLQRTLEQSPGTGSATSRTRRAK